MSTVRSKDGTAIAFDVVGDGPPVIIVDGAIDHRAVTENGAVAKLLADEFRVYTYDRRGRGESTDAAPYAVAREIEDMAALIDDAGAPALLFGQSSGSVLSLDAAAAGLSISRLALWEPPFVVGDERPPLPSDYVQRLDASISAQRPGDAAELFMTAAAGVPGDDVAGMRGSQFWPAVEAVAHTMAYDGRIMGTTMSGAPLPTDRWAAITVPVLVFHGDRTEPWLAAATAALADLLPTATALSVPGEQHGATPDVFAAAVRQFANK